MMLDFKELISKYQMEIKGVLHVGARIGEEASDYRDAGISNVWWVDGNPEVIPVLRKNVSRLGHHVIEALVYEEDDVELTFNITNEMGLSSSILEFGTHQQFSPDMVFVNHIHAKTKTIDTLVSDHGIAECNLLAMDLQGAELHALRGAKGFLETTDYLVTEVNKDEVYVGCAKVWELDAYLRDYGLERVETYWVGDQGWGDGFYIKR